MHPVTNQGIRAVVVSEWSVYSSCGWVSTIIGSLQVNDMAYGLQEINTLPRKSFLLAISRLVPISSSDFLLS